MAGVRLGGRGSTRIVLLAFIIVVWSVWTQHLHGRCVPLRERFDTHCFTSVYRCGMERVDATPAAWQVCALVGEVRHALVDARLPLCFGARGRGIWLGSASFFALGISR